MNDDKQTRYTRRGALGLMALGGGFAILETLGFNQTTSKRDTTIAVDDDGNALLGIDENPSNEDDETVRFTNRADKQFDSVTLSSGGGVAFDVDQDGTLEPNPSFTLEKSGQTGDETLVDVVRTSGSGDADVDITATLSSTTISATRTLATRSSDQLTVTRDTDRLFGVSVTTGSSTDLADIDEIDLVDNDNMNTFDPASQEDFVPRIDEAFKRATSGGSTIGGDTATLGVSESNPGNRNVNVRFDGDSTKANNPTAVDEVTLRDEGGNEETFSSPDTSSQDLLDISLTNVDTGGVVVGEIDINLQNNGGDFSGGDNGTFIVTIESGGGEIRVNSGGSEFETGRALLNLNGNDDESLESGETLRIRVSGNTAMLPSSGETVDLTLLESDGNVINSFTASV